MAIQNTAVLTTPTTIYTCPGVPVTASEEHAVTCMIFCNAGALDTTLSLFAVPDGASYLQCQIIKNLTIPARETVT